jgi:hypothetical protein
MSRKKLSEQHLTQEMYHAKPISFHTKSWSSRATYTAGVTHPQK